MKKTFMIIVSCLIMAAVAYPAAGPPKSPQLYAIDIEYEQEAQANLQIRPYSKNSSTLLIVDHSKRSAICFAKLTDPTIKHVESVTGINRLELASMSLSVTANLYYEAMQSATNPDLLARSLGAPEVPVTPSGCMPGDTIPPLIAGFGKGKPCFPIVAEEDADRKAISENYFPWQTVVITCFHVSSFTASVSTALKQQQVQAAAIIQQIAQQPKHDPYISFIVEFYNEPAGSDLIMEAPSGMFESTSPNSIVSWRADVMQSFGYERNKRGESQFRRSRMNYYGASRAVIVYLLDDKGKLTFCQDGGQVNYADMFFYDGGFYPGNSCVIGSGGAGHGIAAVGRVLAHELGHCLFGFPDMYVANCPGDYKFGINRLDLGCDNQGLMGNPLIDWLDIANVEACAGWTDNDGNGIIDAACPATGLGALIVGTGMYAHVTVYGLDGPPPTKIAFLYVTPQNWFLRSGKPTIIWECLNFYRNGVAPGVYPWEDDQGHSGSLLVTGVDGVPWILTPSLVRNRFIKLQGPESYRRGVVKDSTGTPIMWIPTDVLMVVDSCDLGDLQSGNYWFEVYCWHPAGNISTLYSFQFQISRLAGDANGDGNVNLADIIYLVNYIFKGGPPSTPLNVMDVDCNGKVNLSDTIILVNYIFKGGSKPVQCNLAD